MECIRDSDSLLPLFSSVRMVLLQGWGGGGGMGYEINVLKEEMVLI